MHGLSNLDEIYSEYSLANTDDMIRLWRSEVKVTAGHRGGKGIHVEFIFTFMLLSFCLGNGKSAVI